MLLTSKLCIADKKREITSKAMPARKNRLLVPAFLSVYLTITILFLSFPGS